MDKKKINDKIDKFIYDKLHKNNYEVEKFKAVDLLTWNRLDLAFKLFYLDNKIKNQELALNVYKEDIRSQTLGEFVERGN